MTKLLLLIAAVAVFLGAGATAASAGVIDDVRRGDCIHFDSFRFVTHGAPRGGGDFCLHKAAGSLETTLNLRSLGLDRDLYIHLRPIVLGTTVMWTFDQPISPGIDVEIGHWIDRVQGAIAIDFAPAPRPETRFCEGNKLRYSVQGQAGTGTWIDFHVSTPVSNWWERSSAFAITALGGVGPSSVATLRLPMSRVCAGSPLRAVTGTVTLDQPSTVLGTRVALWGDDDATIRAAGTPVLGADQSTAAVRVLVEGAAIGTHTVTARGGDGTVSGPLRVVDCSFLTTFIPVRRDFWRSCALCDAIHVNASGVMAASLAGTGVIVTEKGLRPVAELIGVDAVPRAINDLGQIAAVSQDGKSSFITGPARDGGDPDVVVHEGIEGLDLGDQGMLVGRNLDGRAVVSGPHGAVVLPVDAKDARATAINALGWVVGTYTDKVGVEHAFVDDGAKLQDVPVQGKGARALAVSDAGQVVGSARDATGRWRAFSYTPDGGVVDLGFDGAKSSEAIAVDALGHVVVAASDGQTRQTFLVFPNGKRVSAKELSSEKAEVGELIGFTRSGSLIARGVFEGEGGLFELVPEDGKQ